MFDKKIYKIDLYSVTQNFNYDNGLSVKENIVSTEHVNLGTILVEKTASKKFVRETITKMLIPVYLIKTDYGMILGEDIEMFELGTDSPLFVKINRGVTWEIECYNDLEEASNELVEEYKKQHSDSDQFSKELKAKYEEAQTYFENGLKASQPVQKSKTMLKRNQY